MAKKKAEERRPTDDGEWKEPSLALWRGGWRLPSGKFNPELRGLALRLTAVYKERPVPTERAKVMQAVLPALLNLIGDHPVVATLGKPRPAAWTSGLAFQKRQYGQEITLPLSELAKPATWAQLEELFEDGVECLRAISGGGASRHRVFAMEVDPLDDVAFGVPYRHFLLTLTVSSQYVSLTGRDFWHVDGVPRDRPVGPKMRDRCWHGLMEQFFDASSRLAEFVRGEGGIVRPDHVTYSLSQRSTCHTGDELVAAVARQISDLDILQMSAPSVATFLGPEQCQRLGGVEAFVRHAAAEMNLPSRAVSFNLRVVPLGSGVLVQLACVTSWLPSREGGISPWAYQWFMGVLYQARLLPRIDSDTRSSISAQGVSFFERADHHFAKALGQLEGDSSRVSDAGRKRDFTPPIARPACVCSARSVIEDCPDDEFVRENVVCWRVRPREGPVDAGLTVYARHSAELGQLIAPVLVGSLDAERAALAFHPRVHGYDAMCEVAESPEGKRREASYGRLKQAVCKGCQSRVFQVWAALEYPDDLEEGDVGAGAKAEEWFSWFWLVTRCASCGEVQTVVDHECA